MFHGKKKEYSVLCGKKRFKLKSLPPKVVCEPVKDNMLITAEEFEKGIKDGLIGYILYIREVVKDSPP